MFATSWFTKGQKKTKNNNSTLRSNVQSFFFQFKIFHFPRRSTAIQHNALTDLNGSKTPTQSVNFQCFHLPWFPHASHRMQRQWRWRPVATQPYLNASAVKQPVVSRSGRANFNRVLTVCSAISKKWRSRARTALDMSPRPLLEAQKVGRNVPPPQNRPPSPESQCTMKKRTNI